jgi:hypothetical protein
MVTLELKIVMMLLLKYVENNCRILSTNQLIIYLQSHFPDVKWSLVLQPHFPISF